MFKNVKKILIFKLCCLGDSVFVTPAIKSVRKNFPDAEIVYAYAEWIEPLMDYIPEINRAILFENIYSKNFLKKAAGAVRFILKVRKEKFDFVLYAHRSNLLSFILKLCGIKYRAGFEGTKFLTHAGKFKKEFPEYYRYLHILLENGLVIDNSLPELKKPVVHLLRKELGIAEDEKVIGVFSQGGLNPGTTMNIKKWNIKNYFRLIELVNESFPGIKIIFFEGKHESEKVLLPPGIQAAKRTISVEYIACCDYFISGDTGSLHIAAALEIPTLSLFGPSDPRLIAPENPSGRNIHKVIWKQPSCSPCYTPDTAIDTANEKYWQNDEFICYTGSHICMKSIAPGEVFEELKKLFKYSKEFNI